MPHAVLDAMLATDPNHAPLRAVLDTPPPFAIIDAPRHACVLTTLSAWAVRHAWALTCHRLDAWTPAHALDAHQPEGQRLRPSLLPASHAHQISLFEAADRLDDALLYELACALLRHHAHGQNGLAIFSTHACDQGASLLRRLPAALVARTVVVTLAP